MFEGAFQKMHTDELVVQRKDLGLWDLALNCSSLTNWLGDLGAGYLASLRLHFLIYLGFNNITYFVIMKLPDNVRS